MDVDHGSISRRESGENHDVAGPSHDDAIRTPGNRGRSSPAGSNGGSPQPRPTWGETTLRILKKFLTDQWFLIAMGVVIAISSQVQVPQSQQALKQTVVPYLSVSLIFFMTGLTLSTKILVDNYKRWKLHLYVQIGCFLVDSATVYGIVSACATNPDFMDPALLVGLIFLGCTPTTISSNIVMTMQAEGNSALTVVQSTLGNFLGPFLMPSLITMYTRNGAWYTDFLPQQGASYDEIYRRVFKQLGLSIFLPMAVGQVIQYFFPKPVQKLKDWKITKLGSFALLAIIWQTYDSAFAQGAFTSVKPSNMIFVVFIGVAFFFLWLTITFVTGIAWLGREDVVSACFCIPAKTPAMAVPLATVMFVGLSPLEDSKLQIPIVIFQGLQIFFSSFLTHVFRKWIRSGREAAKSITPSSLERSEQGDWTGETKTATN